MKSLRNKTRKNYKKRKHCHGGSSGGGQLPPAKIAIFSLEPNKRLGIEDVNMDIDNDTEGEDVNMDVEEHNTNYQKGGDNYVGPTWGNLIITNFRISDNDLLSFQRLTSNVDCAASAMQIVGVIDKFTANIIRIMLNAHQQLGLYANEIESIFSLRTNKKHVFKPTTSAQEFVDFINTHLLPGCVVFCGVTYEVTSHVFLIGRDTSGTYIKIDPQKETRICNLKEEACIHSIFEGARSYFLLYNYENEFTVEEGESMGFTYVNLV